MTDTTTTPPPASTPPPEDTHGDISAREVFARIYAFFYNKRVGLLIILAMAIMTLLGVLFQQAPDVVRDDPKAWSSWLDSLRPRYGGWTDVLAFLGVLTMFSSWLFRIMTILLVLSIIGCTAHRMPLLWKQAMRPHTHVTDDFFRVTPLHGTAHVADSQADALDSAKAALAAKGFRITPSQGAEDTMFYADKFRWAPFGTAVAHLAFVLILLGVFVTSLFGFRNDNVVVPVGKKIPVQGVAGYEILAKSFTDKYADDGRPMDYASDIELFKDGRSVATQVVRVNNPLAHGGYSFNQANFGPSVEVKVEKDGAVVADDSVPLQWTTDDKRHTYGKTSIPAHKLQIYVVSAASGTLDPQIEPGQVRIEVYPEDSTNQIAAKVLNPGQKEKLGDLTYTFVRERPFTGLMVSKDPGAPIVWIGSALLVLGTCITMFLRHHRIWGRVKPGADGGSEVTLATPDRHDSIFERKFHALVSAVGQERKAAK